MGGKYNIPPPAVMPGLMELGVLGWSLVSHGLLLAGVIVLRKLDGQFIIQAVPPTTCICVGSVPGAGILISLTLSEA